MTCYLSYLSHWVKQRCKLKLLFPYFTVLGPWMGEGGREVWGFVQEQSSITTILRFVISRNDMIQVFSVQIQWQLVDSKTVYAVAWDQTAELICSGRCRCRPTLPIRTDFNRSDLYQANHICLSDIGWVCCDWLLVYLTASSPQDTKL